MNQVVSNASFILSLIFSFTESSSINLYSFAVKVIIFDIWIYFNVHKKTQVNSIRAEQGAAFDNLSEYFETTPHALFI